ncbi:MAG: preprotein translocase subunit YajC [Bacteroidales bacterium]|nr:preprotein translocase subunit YajC [Bacteroidales bacterium]MBR3286423.1 preprotein translocase subunit YajC [Bacteroidales bacterium]MCR5714733.1 preprotein translocase subunit YajC [Bacteroidales bacterium]
MNILTVLLQAQGSAASSMVMLLLIIFIFYLFMIRPQVKRQKELRDFRAALQKGDKVVTTGGIYGKIVEVQEQAVIIEIADGVRIKIDKFAVLKDATDLAAGQK